MKDVQCSECGKKRKVGSKAFYAWTHGKVSMVKGGIKDRVNGGVGGKWHCANGYGCSKGDQMEKIYCIQYKDRVEVSVAVGCRKDDDICNLACQNRKVCREQKEQNDIEEA